MLIEHHNDSFLIDKNYLLINFYNFISGLTLFKKSNMNTESPSSFNPHNRKKVHIPFMDVDDLAYNRQDPKFVASISKI